MKTFVMFAVVLLLGDPYQIRGFIPTFTGRNSKFHYPRQMHLHEFPLFASSRSRLKNTKRDGTIRTKCLLQQLRRCDHR